MNVSTYIEGSMAYNTMTGTYKENIKLPKDLQEIMYFTTETYHFIKTSKEPLRKLVVEPDQFGKVLIANKLAMNLKFSVLGVFISLRISLNSLSMLAATVVDLNRCFSMI